MSRPRKPPETLYGVMSRTTGSFVWVNKDVAEGLRLCGEKIYVYELKAPQPAPTPAVTPKELDNREARRLMDDAAVPLRSDKPPEGQPAASLPIVCKTCDGTGLNPKSGIGMPRGFQTPCPDCQPTVEAELDNKHWVCGICGHWFIKPDEVDDIDGEYKELNCPKCGSAKITNTRAKPKRPRRTNKAEIQAAKDGVVEVITESFIKDKPKWKCTVCKWRGDAPHKATSGTKFIYVCPKCESVVEKNE